jgi:hypothetical protein
MALNRLCVCLPQPLLSCLSQHKKPNPAKGHRKENTEIGPSAYALSRPHVRDETSTSLTNSSPARLHSRINEPHEATGPTNRDYPSWPRGSFKVAGLGLFCQEESRNDWTNYP